MVNRAALILRYKEPAVRWINEADPDPDAISISLADANRERTVYLISDEDGDTDAAVRQWVKNNFRTLWETELGGWYTDEELWPEDRTLKKFDQWFDVECHTMLMDIVGEPIIDDEI
jgi:hypothetical protein